MLLNGKNSESGRSVVELIGVLTIMGLITATAFILIRGGMASQRRSVVDDDVAQIVTGVRTLYADYDNLPSNFDGTKTLSALSINVNAPYDGATYDVSRKSGTVFVVKIKDLPERECVVLETKNWAEAINNSATCSSNTLTIEYNK